MIIGKALFPAADIDGPGKGVDRLLSPAETTTRQKKNGEFYPMLSTSGLSLSHVGCQCWLYYVVPLGFRTCFAECCSWCMSETAVMYL